MLNPEVWVTGGTTMAVGMGIVFSFLVIMVFAMLIMANVVAWLNKVCPLPVAEAKTAKKVAICKACGGRYVVRALFMHWRNCRRNPKLCGNF